MHFVEHFPPEPGNEGLDWSVAGFKMLTRQQQPPYICSPPLVMGEVGFLVNGHCVNRDVVAYQERINIMRSAGLFEPLLHKKSPVVLEIGGGYGALAYFIKQILPNSTYVVVDLPQSLIFSTCYLAATLPEQDIRVLDGPGVALPPRSVTAVIPGLIAALGELKIDLAINTLSFAEMPAKVVHDYAAFLRTHLAEGGVLYEQNFDNSHFNSRLDQEHFCNPEAVLSQHFDDCRAPPVQAFWGTPRIWREARTGRLAVAARAGLAAVYQRYLRSPAPVRAVFDPPVFLAKRAVAPLLRPHQVSSGARASACSKECRYD